ncbi:MAG: hypothetical protein WDM76_17790 [Limisphaerales bacterium]
MSRTFETATAMILSVIGVALLGWLFWYALKRNERAGKFLLRCAFSLFLVTGNVLIIRYFSKKLHEGGLADNFHPAFLMAILIVITGIILSSLWTPAISEFLSKPLTSLFDGGDEKPKSKPFYYIAKAKRKRGEFLEALAEVRKQLDHFPNDYQGILLMAAIQAKNLRDLSARKIRLTLFVPRRIRHRCRFVPH